MGRHIASRSVIWLIAVFASTIISTPGVRAQNLFQVLRGYEIAPVQLNLTGKSWWYVGLGSYLVNSTGCNDCHTHPNWAANRNPYLGQPEQINTAEYLAGGRSFGVDTSDPNHPVQIVSANLTPDSTGKPAGLTLAQFLNVMHTGQDPDVPGRLLKVMPWPLYHWKTDDELSAMYEYLRAIPSLNDNMNIGP